MNVLLAVDLRRDAIEVVARARPWLERLQATVDLVYVDTHRASLERYTPASFRTELDRLMLDSEQRMATVFDEIPPPLRGSAFVDTTSMEEMLAARAGRYGLVLVGTRGRVGLAHLWAGSVAEHVVRFSPTSVLVLREDRASEPMRILLAVDLTEDAGPLAAALAP
ncbi:MAG: universal stress protein, partial [Deltaproteobacteria bacterium]|nr:universal stress protein [Deltaproteobacteria bacterium]